MVAQPILRCVILGGELCRRISKKKVLTWDEDIEKKIAKRPERRTQFTTVSEVPVKRVYWPWDVQDFDLETDLGIPGQYPFTRGVQPNMYRGRFWTMRQYAGFGSAAETNKRFKYLIEQGQTGLSVAFDLPTQIGYDSDAELSAGEVGKVGVAIDSVEDLKLLFDGIDLSSVSTSMTINSPAAILLAMYITAAEEQGADVSKIRGTIQNDILKEYPARGTYIFPPIPSMRIITDIFAFCNQHVPQWNTISISGYHIREAGSTAVQEVAFTLANGIAYVQAAIDAGLEVNSFWRKIELLLQCSSRLPRGSRKIQSRPSIVGQNHEGAFPRNKSSGYDAEVPYANGRMHADRSTAR